MGAAVLAQDQSLLAEVAQFVDVHCMIITVQTMVWRLQARGTDLYFLYLDCDTFGCHVPSCRARVVPVAVAYDAVAQRYVSATDGRFYSEVGVPVFDGELLIGFVL